MTPERLGTITARYPALHIAVVGDVCLDRYLEIDPALRETSIETGLPVHNVVRIRAQAGGAGTIVNNLAALGVGAIDLVSYCGDDGEGYELRRALAELAGVRLDHLVKAPDRRTFTYCKPLVVEPGREPVELNRLDSKNWTPTPPALEGRLIEGLDSIAARVDAIIVLEQVDRAGTGVVTEGLLTALGRLAAKRPDLPILADSRRGLRGWPAVDFKMNAAELATLTGREDLTDVDQVGTIVAALARCNGRAVFVTLAERGLIGAGPTGAIEHVPALPVRGPIDVVGAGDAVMANLAAALASGATLRESLELAAVAASVVLHKIGTTGTATLKEIMVCLD